MDKILSDYPTATIAQLCMQYSDAADALSCARNEEVRKHIRTDIKVIFAEIQNRDTELAALRTELAAAMTEIASQNMTIKTLSEHIANSIDDGEEWLESYVGTGGVGE